MNKINVLSIALLSIFFSGCASNRGDVVVGVSLGGTGLPMPDPIPPIVINNL